MRDGQFLLLSHCAVRAGVWAACVVQGGCVGHAQHPSVVGSRQNQLLC